MSSLLIYVPWDASCIFVCFLIRLDQTGLQLCGSGESLDSLGVDCIRVTNCVVGKAAEPLLGVSISFLGVVGVGSELGVAEGSDASCRVFDSDVSSRYLAGLGIEGLLGHGKEDES